MFVTVQQALEAQWLAEHLRSLEVNPDSLS